MRALSTETVASRFESGAQARSATSSMCRRSRFATAHVSLFAGSSSSAPSRYPPGFTRRGGGQNWRICRVPRRCSAPRRRRIPWSRRRRGGGRRATSGPRSPRPRRTAKHHPLHTDRQTDVQSFTSTKVTFERSKDICCDTRTELCEETRSPRLHLYVGDEVGVPGVEAVGGGGEVPEANVPHRVRRRQSNRTTRPRPAQAIRIAYRLQ